MAEKFCFGKVGGGAGPVGAGGGGVTSQPVKLACFFIPGNVTLGAGNTVLGMVGGGVDSIGFGGACEDTGGGGGGEGGGGGAH